MLLCRGFSLFAFIAVCALCTSQATAQVLMGESQVAPQVQGQVLQSSQMYASPGAYSQGAYSQGAYSPVVNQMPAVSSGCSGCSSQVYQPAVAPQVNMGNACCPTAPTIQGTMPRLPVSSCCNNNMGPLNIPRVTTPLRTYMPPVGRNVGRPLIGRWSGF